ncbi:MAG: hypothetical protein KatS3mg102_0958 [Planctomycetota bacterium]|nr:MAG: hypothetical protein KatS3mg102_0958 [Planctomycetota bacterium]
MLELYQPDKARYSRWLLGVTAGAIVLYGAYKLYYSFGEAMRAPIGGWEPLGEEFPISWALVVSVVAGLAGAIGTWWAVNYPPLVEFLHDTEIELAKVSWSSRNEVLGSSAVVLVVTVILGVWVFLVDQAFIRVFDLLGY